MSLRHAMLGLLQGGPKHGYQIRKELERRLGAGRLNSAQVYLALHWLEQRRMVEPKRSTSPGGRDRVEFKLTPSGIDEMGRWLNAPFVARAPQRDDVLAKLGFLGPNDALDLAERLEVLRSHHLRRLAGSESRATRRRTDWLDEEFFAELCATALRIREEAEIAWIDYSIRRIRDLLERLADGSNLAEAPRVEERPKSRSDRLRRSSARTNS